MEQRKRRYVFTVLGNQQIVEAFNMIDAITHLHKLLGCTHAQHPPYSHLEVSVQTEKDHGQDDANRQG